MKTIQMFLGIIMVLAVAACGGGGGGGGDTGGGTTPTIPTVTTNAASSITQSSAALNGYITPNGASTSTWFEWGATPSLGYLTSNVNYGTTATDFSVAVSSLSSSTTYYYRAVAQNSQGTVYGTMLSFTTSAPPIPQLTTGKIVYPCSMAMCTKDLSTGAETVIWGSYNIYPERIVPYHDAANLAFIGSNIGGIATLSLPALGSVGSVDGSGLLAPNCTSWPLDMNFDISPVGDFAAISSWCSPLGQAGRSDIFLVLTDGSLFYARVTDDAAADSFPAIAGVDAATGNTTVLFLSDKVGAVGVWKQVLNHATDTLVGSQVLLASNATSATRAISVNAAYTHFAFTKNVANELRITVMPIAGGAEVDLGPGFDPYWALDGSDLIMYTSGNARFAVKPDGTGRVSIPTPSNLVYGLGNVVFGPPGF